VAAVLIRVTVSLLFPSAGLLTLPHGSLLYFPSGHNVTTHGIVETLSEVRHVLAAVEAGLSVPLNSVNALTDASFLHSMGRGSFCVLHATLR
jgi:hypothetical protein